MLEFPQSWLRGRRDHDRFLSLIEGIAFLHQYQRPIGQDGNQEYIEASVEDYAHAYDLAQSVFANTLGDLPKPVMDLLGQIRKMNKGEFTRRDVREFTRLPDHLVKRQMRTLEDLEYVSVTRAPSGGSFRYRLFAQEENSPALSGLTPPETLQQKAEQAGHNQN